MSRKMTRKPTHPGEIIKVEYMETLRLSDVCRANISTFPKLPPRYQ